MFKHEKEVTFNARTFCRAFMKKFVILATLITLISTFSLTVFAAERNGLSYSGESYNATVKYGVNMRDKNDNIISYLGAGTSVKVLGTYSKDSSRVVIEYGKTVGTVLGSGLKKSSTSTGVNQSSSGLKYSGSSYYATVKYGLNFRDKNNNIIRYLNAGTKVYVRGIYSNDFSRAVIEYNGVIGTVLNVGLKKSSVSDNENQSNSELKYSGKSYYGKVKYYLNVRDVNNNIIGTITKNEVVCVLGVYSKDSSRVVIEYRNSKCTVLKAGLVEVSYNEKPSQKPTEKYYYAVTVNGLNLRDNNGNLICYIPKNNLICVKGAYSKDGNRVVVTFNGTEGNVLKGGVKEIKNAIFISIPNQKVTLIKNNAIVAESKCVTGTKNVYDTPCGAYKINSMEKNATLRGKNSDGTSYVQPVDYWMPFYNGYGLHDANWRSTFGGTIYQNNGSHGCVNLPNQFAKTLYNNAYVGMPVYVA